jgi:hypothetical protein
MKLVKFPRSLALENVADAPHGLRAQVAEQPLDHACEAELGLLPGQLGDASLEANGEQFLHGFGANFSDAESL